VLHSFTHSHNVILNRWKALSHWCVFHHRYCRLVVETWDSEFHASSSERRLSLLYLANDIMQNSRKEGNGYITEFMRVIPAALNEVLTIRDDLGRNVVKRLVCRIYSFYHCSWKSISIHTNYNCVFSYHCITNMLTTYVHFYVRVKLTRMASAKRITQWFLLDFLWAQDIQNIPLEL
jgi:regulator of Ty1 transposition protein 103